MKKPSWGPTPTSWRVENAELIWVMTSRSKDSSSGPICSTFFVLLRILCSILHLLHELTGFLRNELGVAQDTEDQIELRDEGIELGLGRGSDRNGGVGNRGLGRGTTHLRIDGLV